MSLSPTQSKHWSLSSPSCSLFSCSVRYIYRHSDQRFEKRFYLFLTDVSVECQWPSLWIVCSLLPIVAGVSLASFTEASFNWYSTTTTNQSILLEK